MAGHVLGSHIQLYSTSVSTVLPAGAERAPTVLGLRVVCAFLAELLHIPTLFLYSCPLLTHRKPPPRACATQTGTHQGRKFTRERTRERTGGREKGDEEGALSQEFRMVRTSVPTHLLAGGLQTADHALLTPVYCCTLDLQQG